MSVDPTHLRVRALAESIARKKCEAFIKSYLDHIDENEKEYTQRDCLEPDAAEEDFLWYVAWYNWNVGINA